MCTYIIVLKNNHTLLLLGKRAIPLQHMVLKGCRLRNGAKERNAGPRKVVGTKEKALVLTIYITDYNKARSSIFKNWSEDVFKNLCCHGDQWSPLDKASLWNFDSASTRNWEDSQSNKSQKKIQPVVNNQKLAQHSTGWMRKDPPSWAIVNYMVKLRMDWVACFLVTKQKDDYDNNNKKKVDIFEFSTKHYCMKKYLKLTVHSTNVESFQDISRLLISRIPR